MSQTPIPSYGLYGEAYGSRFPDCLHCETISDRSRPHDWRIRPHRHYGLHQFLWIGEGEVTMSTDSHRQVLSAPAAIMNAPAVVHGFAFEPGTEGYVVTIPTVNLERSPPGPAALTGRLDRSIILEGSTVRDGAAEALAIFAALAREYHGRDEGRAEALLCHAGLLALWFLRRIDRCETDGRARARPQIDLVRRFLTLIEDGFREPRPLTAYARELRITTTHLSRTCRRRLGLSALALVQNRRILEAKRSLAYTPATIADIAEELGFVDPAYFTRFFVQHVGQAPSAFRKGFGE